MSERLREGKVPWDVVAEVVGGDLPPGVLLGPACGEDAALVEIGGEVWAVASDPISFTATDAGRLAVVVNANDVAVRGAEPRFFLAVVLLAPEEATTACAHEILGQIQTTCADLGVALVGGHTEVTPGLPHSIVVGTMLGPVVARPITTGGLREGDLVGISKWAGLEGTAILLAELGDRLRSIHGEKAIRPHRGIYARPWLPVVPEALAAAGVAAVSALHDVTEGGVGEALHELGRASGLELEVDPAAIPVLPETALVCADLGIDPLGLIGSGALLVGCAEEGRSELERAIADLEIPFTWIGRAVAGSSAIVCVPRFPRDELLKAYLMDGVTAVLFDMDGTLVDSEYDWPAIRGELGVTGPSIIDDLNGLPAGERDRKWQRLQRIEATATRAARLKEGVPELLGLLRANRLRTALVTNNDDDNTRQLLDRFGLDFDVVLTRSSGLWKPSGAPLAEAVRRLAVEASQTLAVGDSIYDLQSAREAGCGRVCMLYGGAQRHGEAADLSFADVTELTRFLEVVLPEKRSE